MSLSRLSIALLLVLLVLPSATLAATKDDAEPPATPVFLAGVDSGGAGAGVLEEILKAPLPNALWGECADVVGICACVANYTSGCSGQACRLVGGQGCQLN